MTAQFAYRTATFAYLAILAAVVAPITFVACTGGLAFFFVLPGMLVRAGLAILVLGIFAALMSKYGPRSLRPFFAAFLAIAGQAGQRIGT